MRIMKNTELLKKLREDTGLSYSECLKALNETKDDLKAAKELLKKRGLAFAEKKANREAKEGGIFTYVHHNKKIGAMIELRCETDFVAKNDDFVQLGTDIAMQIASLSPKNSKELYASEFVKDPAETIETLIKKYIFKLGEKIKIERFERYSL